MPLNDLGIEDDINEFLFHVASAFRDAFDQTDLSQAHGFLRGFPKGNCNRATLFIGRFLHEEYNLSGYEVCGDRESPDGLDSHAWLKIGNTIIDITCDQYNENKEKVITSFDSAWHKSWQNKAYTKITDIVLHISKDDDAVYAKLKQKVIFSLQKIQG